MCYNKCIIMPSKKILVTSIICVSIIASVVILQWKTNIKIFIPKNNSLVVENSATTGNSNFQNWKNILSDMTGTTTVMDSTGKPVDPNNLTAQIAQNSFGQFLALSQNGTQVTENNASQIAQNTINGINYNNTVENIYTVKNLKIETNNIANIQTYFDILSRNLVKNNVLGDGSEIDIINRATVSEKESDLSKLDPIIAKYKQTVSDLLKMSIPSDAVQIHLELLNDTNNILSDIKYMREILSDPIKGLIGLKSYENHYTNLTLSAQKISAYFRLKNIIR